MQEIGTIVDFTDEGKAIVEFEARPAACAGCAAGGMCRAADGFKRRMELEVIPGVAEQSRVYVDVGPRTLLKFPMLAYVMIAAFLAGAIAAQIIAWIFGVKDAGTILSLLLGLLATAAAIIVINIKETKRSKEEFTPHIVGIVWRNH